MHAQAVLIGRSASQTISGPRSEPPMPMLTTSAIAPARVSAPRAAAHGALKPPSGRARCGYRASRPRRRPSTARPPRLRSATCSTARCSVLLIARPRTSAPSSPAGPGLGQPQQPAERLLGHQVLRIVEEHPGRLGRQRGKAPRIGREELAQMDTGERLAVRPEVTPFGQRGEVRHRVDAHSCRWSAQTGLAAAGRRRGRSAYSQTSPRASNILYSISIMPPAPSAPLVAVPTQPRRVVREDPICLQ